MIAARVGRTLGLAWFLLSPACTNNDSSPGNQPPGTENPTTPPAPQTGRFVAQSVATLPDFPSAMVFTSPNRILYTEKGGFGGTRDARVRVVESGVLLDAPLITVREVQTRSEMGLLGITLDPDYSANRLVYIFYTHGPSGRNRVARFRDEGSDLRTASLNILRDDLPADVCGNHQGGNMAFGPDGMLYVSIGDNGCDACTAQSGATLAGKILRLTRDGLTPPDTQTPMFASGLRNSFDITFHPQTGELFATENGPSANDEINRILPGSNQGWPFFECDQATSPGCPGPRPASPMGPIQCYPRVNAPTGIAVYDGDAYPAAFRGNLFFGDFNFGDLHRLVLSPDSTTVVSADDEFLMNLGRITDVVDGPDGRLYVLTDGEILRIEFIPDP